MVLEIVGGITCFRTSKAGVSSFQDICGVFFCRYLVTSTSKKNLGDLLSNQGFHESFSFLDLGCFRYVHLNGLGKRAIRPLLFIV